MKIKKKKRSKRPKYRVKELTAEVADELVDIRRQVIAAPTVDRRCAILKAAIVGRGTSHWHARRAWERHRNRSDIKEGPCIACHVRATHQHHIIPLSHGGHPTAKENRVWICHDCHAVIHPHLQTPELTATQQRQADEAKPCWA